MSETQVVVKKSKQLSKIWFIPIIAAVLGLFLTVQNYLSKGPEITLVFNTASGIEAGKTKVKYRNVDIGLVTDLNLTKDNKSVELVIQLDPDVKKMLRTDTQFWVVKPRIGAEGVSGLSTLLSGGYIKLAPGNGKETSKRIFTGLEEIPVTPAGTPGLRLTLTSESVKSLSIGDPVIYRGFTVGQVETSQVDPESHKIIYDIFIKSQYKKYVTSKTRFWNSGGVDINITTDGIHFNMESIFTLLAGGVSFDLPEDSTAGRETVDGEKFNLFPDKDSINNNPHRKHKTYIVTFQESIRGLNYGAAVEYRGIPVGRVVKIMIQEVAESSEFSVNGPKPIPIKIRLTPALFKMADTQVGVDRMSTAINHAVNDLNLRATLKTSSLLTGQRYINLDFHPNDKPKKLGQLMGLEVIPSVAGGIDDIQQQINALLKKLNALPLNSLVDSADGFLQQFEKTLAAADTAMDNANKILGSEKLQKLPATLDATIQSYSSNSELYDRLNRTTQELNDTLLALQNLANTLNKQPNSLIFPRKNKPDLQPNSSAGGE
jgi:paraquat-inducible protein B